MAHGLRDGEHLVIDWQWLPVPPRQWTEALPVVQFRDDASFLSVESSDPAKEMTTFQFSFPQLSKQTPDLRFYKLIQVFNTPLLSLSSREAANAGFAYWRGVSPQFRDDRRWAHFWFFRDAGDQDDVVVEFGFDGGLVLYSEKKSVTEVAAKFQKVVERLTLGSAG